MNLLTYINNRLIGTLSSFITYLFSDGLQPKQRLAIDRLHMQLDEAKAEFQRKNNNIHRYSDPYGDVARSIGEAQQAFYNSLNKSYWDTYFTIKYEPHLINDDGTFKNQI